MFEIVYGDAIPMYSHQSDRPRPDDARNILDHILYAEMPVYYFGNHHYWTDPSQEFRPGPGAESQLVFARDGRFGIIDQFIKNTYEVLSPLHRVSRWKDAAMVHRWVANGPCYREHFRRIMGDKDLWGHKQTLRCESMKPIASKAKRVSDDSYRPGSHFEPTLKCPVGK
jgi:hypothetical protein